MKTVMKKMFCLMLVAVLMVGVMPFQAFADSTYVITLKVFDNIGTPISEITKQDTALVTVQDYLYHYWRSDWTSQYQFYGADMEGSSATLASQAADVDANGAIAINVYLTPITCATCGRLIHSEPCCDVCFNLGGTHTTACIKGCTGLENCPQDAGSHKPDCASKIVCSDTVNCNLTGGRHTATCTALCTEEVDCTNPAHKKDCKSQIVCPACAKVGGTHYDNCLVPCNETAECTSKAHKVTCLAPCTGLANCTSPSHKENCLSKLTCSYCGQKGHVSTTCPNYYYSCGCLKASGHAANCNAAKWNVTFSPNYNTTAATTLSVVNGSKLYDAYTPVRVGHSFSGWYYDDLCTNKVPADAVVTAPMTVYAKWTPNAPYPVSVIVYTNGNTKTPVVTLDLYSWALDGEITLTDLQQAIANHGIKANNNAGLTIYGPYTPSQWVSYTNNSYYKNVTEKVKINTNEATVLYTMVHNVKITKGTTDPYGAIADKTNPKTGDEIFMPVAVLGLSASALAVMFYLNNKKRAF